MVRNLLIRTFCNWCNVYCSAHIWGKKKKRREQWSDGANVDVPQAVFTQAWDATKTLRSSKTALMTQCMSITPGPRASCAPLGISGLLLSSPLCEVHHQRGPLPGILYLHNNSFKAVQVRPPLRGGLGWYWPPQVSSHYPKIWLAICPVRGGSLV